MRHAQIINCCDDGAVRILKQSFEWLMLLCYGIRGSDATENSCVYIRFR
jgi:hypothetical protein